MTAPGRMERARELARQAILDGGGDRVAVVAFDQRADVLAPIGAPSDARAAIDRVEAGFGGTRYGVVFDKASELLSDEPRGRLVIVTDMQRTGFDGSLSTLPDSVELVVRDVGPAGGNLAVIDARAEARRVVATILNAGSTARGVDARLESAGQVHATRHIEIAPTASIEIPFEGVPPTGGFDVAVNDAEGYAADNVRYAVNAARTLPRIAIVTGAAGSGDGFYLSRALQAGGDDGADFDVHLEAGASFVGRTAADLRQEAAIVLLSTHGIDRRLRDPLHAFLAGGGGLLVAAAADVDASVLSTTLDWTPPLRPRERAASGVLAATDLRHPVLKPIAPVAANLGQVSFERIWQVDPGQDWRVIARYTDGAAALLERSAGRGRILLFTSDLDRRWNDFPLHSTYVPFVQEVVRYLGARPPAAASVLVSDVPAGMAATPGVVQAEGRTLAVNVDPRESAVDRVGPAEFGRLVSRTSADPKPLAVKAGQQAEARQQYWHYGLLLMLGVLIAEAFVGAG
jgi:hypothetical protein